MVNCRSQGGRTVIVRTLPFFRNHTHQCPWYCRFCDSVNVHIQLQRCKFAHLSFFNCCEARQFAGVLTALTVARRDEDATNGSYDATNGSHDAQMDHMTCSNHSLVALRMPLAMYDARLVSKLHNW